MKNERAAGVNTSSSASELLSLSALAQAELIRRGHISSEELVRVYLARIERHNPTLQAFVQVTATAALLDARAKDRARTLRSLLGAPLPTFYGVPTGIKDLNLARGTFTRFGSRAMRHFWSPIDDKTTASLRRAGFIVLGKLATSEFGAMPVTEPEIHAPTRNPWSLEHTAGGSSGGSGAALAGGLVPIVQGSDGAGSIRIPSSFCHLFGLKPSRGRVPDPFGRDDRTALATMGPMAHSVEDAAAMLDAMADLGEGRAHWAPRPPIGFAAAVRAVGQHPARPLRVRFSTLSPIATTDPEIHDAVLATARTLEQLGHHVEEGKVPEGELAEFLPLWQYIIAHVPVRGSARMQAVTRWLFEAGRAVPKGFAAQRFGELRARIHAWFGDADIWLTPAVPIATPAIGAWQSLAPDAAFAEAAKVGAFTAVFNIGGHPAASVPAGLSRSGLPMGVQLAGRVFEDDTVLAVARQLEQARPWAARRSPLFRS